MEWISIKERMPENEGRYLILSTFHEPCISNDKIVRKHIPFVSNYTIDKGWMSRIPAYDITHWMEIPEPPEN